LLTDNPQVHWLTTRFRVDLTQPRVMGIVNVTPDSFFEGARHGEAAAAMARCDQLLAEGADLLDIGGESTRPGATAPTLDDELARVLPVLRHAVTLGVPVSVDTSRPEVMRAALDIGVDIVNDVRALQRPGALACLAAHPRAGVCLMHMRGEPGSMHAEAVYGDVVQAVLGFLQGRVDAARLAGIERERIVVDPGIGFAKTPAHNVELLWRQRELLALGVPLLVGWSRKSTLGVITGRAAGDRQAASLGAALAAVQRGASVLRVHDVAATVDALRVWRCADTGALPPG
jgi:dihydropteroate synthase